MPHNSEKGKNWRITKGFFEDIVRGALIGQTITSTGSIYDNPIIQYFYNNSELVHNSSLNTKEVGKEALNTGAMFGFLADAYMIGMAAGTLGESNELAQGVLAAKGLGILAYQGTKTVKRINRAIKERSYMKMIHEKFPELEESDLEKISSGLRE